MKESNRKEQWYHIHSWARTTIVIYIKIWKNYFIKTKKYIQHFISLFLHAGQAWQQSWMYHGDDDDDGGGSSKPELAKVYKDHKLFHKYINEKVGRIK